MKSFSGNGVMVASTPRADGAPRYTIATTSSTVTLTDEQAKDVIKGLIEVGWGGPLK